MQLRSLSCLATKPTYASVCDALSMRGRGRIELILVPLTSGPAVRFLSFAAAGSAPAVVRLLSLNASHSKVLNGTSSAAWKRQKLLHHNRGAEFQTHKCRPLHPGRFEVKIRIPYVTHCWSQKQFPKNIRGLNLVRIKAFAP